MNLKPYLELDDVSLELGPTTTVRGFCDCRNAPGSIPLRTVDRTMKLILELLQVAIDSGAPAPEPTMTFQTYRCTKCKKVAQITLEAVGILTP